MVFAKDKNKERSCKSLLNTNKDVGILNMSSEIYWMLDNDAPFYVTIMCLVDTLDVKIRIIHVNVTYCLADSKFSPWKGYSDNILRVHLLSIKWQNRSVQKSRRCACLVFDQGE